MGPNASTLYSVFGAPGDTGNLGVGALSEATLQGIQATDPNARILVFDNGRGRRGAPHESTFDYERDGAWISRRIYRSESLWSMWAASHIGSLGSLNRNIAAIRASRAVLDISGGDSFTDLYGEARWKLVALPKLMSLKVRTPLVLLPQTYGPFLNAGHREQATTILNSAHAAWTRDAEGLNVLEDMLGERFDPKRHRAGVDVAFALPALEPAMPAFRAQFEDLCSGDRVVMGLNLSGLLTNDPRAAEARFGLSLDYRALMQTLARRLLDDVADHIVLVPHVRGGGGESDDPACNDLREHLACADRVSILPAGLTASQTKWCISRLDWFCGTRMHATIGALSSGVPASAVAYSLKTKAVFDTCGMGHAVVDARTAKTEDAIDRLVGLATHRDADHKILRANIGPIVEQSRAQFTEILSRSASADTI